MTSTSAGGGGWEAARFGQEVQALLEDHVDEQARGTALLGPDAADLVDAARTAVSGGKRFRAMFCFWGFHAVRPTEDEVERTALLRAAAALELLHASALVHDDLMDASASRRGRPSVHREFEDRHRAAGWPGDPAQYGAAAAVLLGDLLLSWSDERLRTCGIDHDRTLRALRVFDLTRTEVVLGQFLDVSAQARGSADVEQSMRVLRYKSAKYSVERPLHIGATLAGGTAGTLRALTAYGLPLGEAFQLRDDLLGVFGDPEVTGKPAGDDLSEGKRTVLAALAVGSPAISVAERRELERSLGQPLSSDEIVQLQGVIERSGAAAEVERRIESLTEQAMAALADPAIRPEAAAVLAELGAAAARRAL